VYLTQKIDTTDLLLLVLGQTCSWACKKAKMDDAIEDFFYPWFREHVADARLQSILSPTRHVVKNKSMLRHKKGYTKTSDSGWSGTLDCAPHVALGKAYTTRPKHNRQLNIPPGGGSLRFPIRIPAPSQEHGSVHSRLVIKSTSLDVEQQQMLNDWMQSGGRFSLQHARVGKTVSAVNALNLPAAPDLFTTFLPGNIVATSMSCGMRDGNERLEVEARSLLRLRSLETSIPITMLLFLLFTERHSRNEDMRDDDLGENSLLSSKSGSSLRCSKGAHRGVVNTSNVDILQKELTKSQKAQTHFKMMVVGDIEATGISLGKAIFKGNKAVGKIWAVRCVCACAFVL
jgi:hypothetical protein